MEKQQLKPFALRIEDSVKEQLKDEATKQGRSINGQIRHYIKQQLKLKS